VTASFLVACQFDAAERDRDGMLLAVVIPQRGG
jgi:hypothetical protein